jgi:hypothetical protein
MFLYSCFVVYNDTNPCHKSCTLGIPSWTCPVLLKTVESVAGLCKSRVPSRHDALHFYDDA